jgi:hypothetical protein
LLLIMKNSNVCAAFLVIFAVFASNAPAAFTKGRVFSPFKPDLKPGEYVWHPEVSPAGSVVIIVSLPDQVMYVYRNGVRIARSTSIGGRRPDIKDLVKRVSIPPAFRDNVRALITPGTTLIMTDLPVSAHTHSAPGSNILTAQAETSASEAR